MPPSSDTLFSLADELAAFKEAQAGELSTEEWEGLNEYDIMLRTAANIFTGVAVDSYLIEMVQEAESVLQAARENSDNRE